MAKLLWEFDQHSIPPAADVESVAEKKRRAIAAELRAMMEHQWRSPRVANARRFARWTPPMRLGSTWGYQDDLLGE